MLGCNYQISQMSVLNICLKHLFEFIEKEVSPKLRKSFLPSASQNQEGKTALGGAPLGAALTQDTDSRGGQSTDFFKGDTAKELKTWGHFLQLI